MLQTRRTACHTHYFLQPLLAAKLRRALLQKGGHPFHPVRAAKGQCKQTGLQGTSVGKIHVEATTEHLFAGTHGERRFRCDQACLGQTNLHAMNGTKNLVSALLTAIAVAIYAAGGVVQWQPALLMMVAATLGGYLGARVARKIAPQWLRAGIVLTGLVMAVLFFLKA